MKKGFPILLVILPISLFLLGNIVKAYQGNYFFGFLSDPAYMYLINALNLIQLNPPGHVDNPGTTVQFFGAFVIILIYYLIGKGDLLEDVFLRPELYLFAINQGILILLMIGLFYTGFMVFRFTKNIFKSLFIQLSPFISIICISNFTRVGPEPFLIFTAFYFIILVLAVAYLDDLEINYSNYVIKFGIVSGFGLLTKFNFFPLFIIPIILLAKIKLEKGFLTLFLNGIAKYFGILLTTLLVLGFPVLYSYQYLGHWILGLIIRSGRYGQGEPIIVAPSIFFPNLLKIASTEFLLLFVIILIGLSLIIAQRFEYFKNIKNQKKTIYLILIALFFALSFQVFIVAKHYATHYLIPSLMFLPTALLLLYEFFKDSLKSLKFKRYVFISFVFILILFFVGIGNKLFERLILYANRKIDYKLAENRIKSLKKQGKTAIIYGNSTLSQAMALKFGMNWAQRGDFINYEKLYAKLYAQDDFFIDEMKMNDLKMKQDKFFVQSSQKIKDNLLEVYIENQFYFFHFRTIFEARNKLYFIYTIEKITQSN